MSRVRVAAFSASLDGFGAGSRQDLNNPLGVRGTELHEWFFQTQVFKKMHGQSGGKLGVELFDLGDRRARVDAASAARCRNVRRKSFMGSPF